MKDLKALDIDIQLVKAIAPEVGFTYTGSDPILFRSPSFV